MAEYFKAITTEAYISGSWSDISAYVVGDIEGQIGIYNDSYVNRLASSGNLMFVVNNASGNFTPNSGFQKGTKVRVRANYGNNIKKVFFGYINTIKIDAGTWGEQRVRINALDWMSFASNNRLRVIPPASNQEISAAVTTLLGYSSKLPEDTDFDTGDNTFITVFDAIDANSTIYSELNNLVMSELGQAYLRDGGEILRIENSSARNGARTLISGTYSLVNDTTTSYLLLETGDKFLLEDGGKLILDQRTDYQFLPSFDRVFVDLDVAHGENVINEIKLTVFPRKSGDAAQVLFVYNNATASAIPIAVGQSYVLEGEYSDPAGGNQISAVDVITPVLIQDYTFNASPYGTGTSYSDQLGIEFVAGATQFRATITNNGTGTTNGYLNFFRVRGTPVYKYSQIDTIIEDESSQTENGLYPISINQPYMDNPSAGTLKGQEILANESSPRNKVKSAKFIANTSQTDMNGFMMTDIGDLIEIKNTKPSVSNYFYIQGMKFSISPGHVVKYEYILQDANSRYSGMTPITIDYSPFDGCAVIFPPASQINNLTTKTYSFWITCPIADAMIFSKTGYDTADGDQMWPYSPLGGADGRIRFVSGRSNGSTGIWYTTGTVLGAASGSWAHVALTYDESDLTNNDPIIYVNGSSVPIVQTSTPSGARDDSFNSLTLGNSIQQNGDITRNLYGKIFDFRIYNRVLSSAEVTAIRNGGTPSWLAGTTDGLVFQAYAVPTTEASSYIGTLSENRKVHDIVYGLIGTPYSSPVGSAAP